ncbi:ethylene-responsive transcription factor RAP2-7-like isoform X2 [Gossypium australe]|uniref:Ethylene-responsive transcription factor RAP2-7-like isoform X2 n=1 Tax=Gossypium australe TaxID=47621 RepID=A0A5B6UKI2_9ROSI|nr:ethylene-responsive transcription factor RAP2-7-like isoform X2 [Gossypium australe]
MIVSDLVHELKGVYTLCLALRHVGPQLSYMIRKQIPLVLKFGFIHNEKEFWTHASPPNCNKSKCREGVVIFVLELRRVKNGSVLPCYYLKINYKTRKENYTATRRTWPLPCTSSWSGLQLYLAVVGVELIPMADRKQ